MELKEAIDGLKRDWEGYKETNQERIDAAVKGAVDPLIEEKLKTANDDFSTKFDEIMEAQKGIKAEAEAQTKRADELEAALKRASDNDNGVDFGEAHKFMALAQHKSVDQLLEDQVDMGKFNDYEKSFVRSYLRRSEKHAMNDAETKALSIAGDPQGGYLVPPTMATNIITKIFETSPVRSIASTVTIGTDRWEVPLDRDEATTGWVGETAARSETDTPELGKFEIPVHEQYANPRITQNMLDDAQLDIAGWLNGKVADKLARTENTAFVNGNGVTQPRGFMDYASTAVTTADASRAFGVLQYIITGASGGFNATDPGNALIDLVYALKAGYRQGASWAMSRSTVGAVRKIQDGDGNYLWQPNFTDLQQSNLLGATITELEDMAAIGADSFSIAFGNFSAGYQIVDRQGIRLLVDPYSAKPYVQYYTTKRVGGDVVDSEAIKLLKFGTS
jgi:HK97 family phage major capsid protein